MMNFGRYRHIGLVATMLLALSGPPALAAQKAILAVDGLACPFCAYGIEKKLKQTPGVADFTIDINSGTIEVTIREGATFDEQAARRVVKEAGFSLRSFKVVDDGS